MLHTIYLQSIISFFRVLPREAQIKLESFHSPPALIGERYKVRCVLKNQEAVPIDRLRFRAYIAEEDRATFSAGKSFLCIMDSL